MTNLFNLCLYYNNYMRTVNTIILLNDGFVRAVCVCLQQHQQQHGIQQLLVSDYNFVCLPFAFVCLFACCVVSRSPLHKVHSVHSVEFFFIFNTRPNRRRLFYLSMLLVLYAHTRTATSN